MIIPRSTIAWSNGKQDQRHRRTVFLVGLPGAGKTTLARALAERLGWRCFMLGDALRERATADALLRDSLRRGDLAPEPLVKELVSKAARAGHEPGLIVDGFPRHPEQIGLAEELSVNWTVLHLDVPVGVAVSRLQARLVCGVCGEVKPSSRSPIAARCPKCGTTKWSVRIEDEGSAIAMRVRTSEDRLKRLVESLPARRIIRVGGDQSPQRLVDLAVHELMITRLS